MPNTMAIGTCESCGFVNVSRSSGTVQCLHCPANVNCVESTVNGALNVGIPCDGACQYAVGNYCSCQCGGENHRRGYIQPYSVPAHIRERDRKRHEQKQERKRNKIEKEQRTREEKKEELLSDFPGLHALLGEEYEDVYGFAADMKFALSRGEMSTKQVDAALAMIQRDREYAVRQEQWKREEEERKATALDVPTGRVTFTGTVISTKKVLDHFKYYESYIYKMVVQCDDGYRVYGTIPKGIPGFDDELKGKRVEVTATLEPSSDDPKFGFFKRPAGKLIDS